MWKAILAGTTALVIAGSTIAYAQQRQGRPEGTRRWQPSIEDMRAFADARLAALRAGLVLSAEQQAHWPAFEKAARSLQKIRMDRIDARRTARRDRQARTRDPVERMRQRAIRLSETGAALRNFADAMGPLYSSLDEAQRRRFNVLARMAGPRGRRGMQNRDGGRRPGWNRGHRHTEVAPQETDGLPMFSRKTQTAEVAEAPVVTFSAKSVPGAPAAVVGETPAPAVAFSAKTGAAPIVAFTAKTRTLSEPVSTFTAKTRADVAPVEQEFRAKAPVGETL
ncbi:MAG: Spy/CpxP family protein refolding chaperone [Xanthobacteraceae bacterium]